MGCFVQCRGFRASVVYGTTTLDVVYEWIRPFLSSAVPDFRRQYLIGLLDLRKRGKLSGHRAFEVSKGVVGPLDHLSNTLSLAKLTKLTAPKQTSTADDRLCIPR